MRNSFHHKLMRTHLLMHKAVMARAKELGLTSGQPKILEFLYEREGVEQKTIAECCGIERATAGSLLDRMESAGLIERRRQNGNRRSLYVYLTPAGRRAAEQTEAIFADAEREALAGMDADERAELLQWLDRAYENLNEKEKGI